VAVVALGGALSGKFPYEWKLEKLTEIPPLSAKRHSKLGESKSIVSLIQSYFSLVYY